MKLFFLSTIFSATSLLGQVCRLEVRPVDTQGMAIEAGSFVLQNEATEYPANKLVDVPCRQLVFAVRSNGFETSHVLLNALPGDNFVSVGLSVGKISGYPRPSFQAVSVSNYDKYSACDRLKVIPPYRSELAFETKLSYRGRASVYIERPGVFVFVLLSPTGVCGASFKRLDSSTSAIDLDIKPIAP